MVTAVHLPTIRAIVACGQVKARHGAPACDLYVGPYFRSMADAARRVFHPGAILILSARHGLVGFEWYLDPYDTAWTDADAITAPELAEQATQYRFHEPVLVFGGRRYVDAAQAFAQPVQAFHGGLGEQRAQAAAFTITQALELCR